MSKSSAFRYALSVFITVTTLVGYTGATQKKEQKQFPPGDAILWRDPGDVASLDFRYGVGGSERQPQPPFQFLGEDSSGTTPKINVIDARGVRWNLKWGNEVLPTTFCTRLAWACGYITETEYFVGQGRIDGVRGLTRAKSHVAADGSFTDARFQMRVDSPRFLKDFRWTWLDNPFQGTRELQGLKLLSLLVSNMDAKNTNLGVFLDDAAGQTRYLYAAIDWGGSLGKWGNVLTRSIADCKGFADQTQHFTKGVENGLVRWDFAGKHHGILTDDIRVSDVQWLLQYLGKITDEQIRTGLASSGATPDATGCYAQALRERIRRLQAVAENSVVAKN